MTLAEDIAKQLLNCFKKGGKVLIMGNGGSAQMSNHLAAELVHEGYPAISLSSDTSVITALSNDADFSEVFALQVNALGKKGDILLGMSTSGRSRNLIYAYQTAERAGLKTIDFPRRGKTPRCQEFQLRLLHKVWEYLK